MTITKRTSHFLKEDRTKFAATIFFKDQQKTFGITIDRNGLGEFTVVLKLSRLDYIRGRTHFIKALCNIQPSCNHQFVS